MIRSPGFALQNHGRQRRNHLSIAKSMMHHWLGELVLQNRVRMRSNDVNDLMKVVVVVVVLRLSESGKAFYNHSRTTNKPRSCHTACCCHVAASPYWYLCC